MSEEQDSRHCDYFVSYTGADTAWAEWIAWQLKEAGYTVMIQAWHFRPGMNFVTLMRQALDTCQRTVAVVSQAYLDQSIYGSDEWTAAFTHDDPASSSLLLVLVEPVSLPRLLRPWIHISLAGLGPEPAAARLLDGVRPGAAEPTVAPEFPGRSRVSTNAGPQYPGQHPEITNLPARNAAFSGRDELLGELRGRLHQEGSAVAVVPAQALYGLGGVGKTQLALEYAHRYQADYNLIWWIEAEAPGAIPAGLATLAPRLGLVDDPNQVADQEQLAAAVLEALRRRSRWLLVFDNVPDRQQLKPYLPQGDGQVLITSRYPVWGGTAQPVKVDTFSRAESVAFVTRRTGAQDASIADALAEELGDLALALEQAAAYLEQTGMPLPEYLELFRHRREELLGRGEPTAYQATVDTTWQLAIEQVATIQPSGQHGIALLRLCAFLSPEGIPLDLLTGHSDQLPEELAVVARDQLTLQDAVAALYRYSLVDRDQAGLRIHRLVQAVVRARLSEDDRLHWAETTVSLLLAGFPLNYSDLTSWPIYQRLLPHVLAAADHAARLGVAGEQTGWLLSQASGYLRRRGQPRQARPLAERALTVTEAVPVPNQREVGDRHDELGRVLRDLGDLTGARVELEQSLEIGKTLYGPEHPDVAATRANLGGVLRALGDLTGARVELEQSLVILEAANDPDDTQLAAALNNLGHVLIELGDFDGARARLEESLAITEAALGPSHPYAATTRINLGGVLQRSGDFTEARVQFEKALEIDEAAYGPDHPEVATDRWNLGVLLVDLGDLTGARGQLAQTLAIYEAAYGDNHPSTKAVRRMLMNLNDN